MKNREQETEQEQEHEQEQKREQEHEQVQGEGTRSRTAKRTIFAGWPPGIRGRGGHIIGNQLRDVVSNR